jgi:hypothetical protein
MGSRHVYTCDHCGDECDGSISASIYGVDGRPNSRYVGDPHHGCSREHLGFDLAKTFGIPIDGDLTAKLDRLQVELNANKNANKNANMLIAAQSAELECARNARTHHENVVVDLRPLIPQVNITDPSKPTKPVCAVCKRGLEGEGHKVRCKETMPPQYEVQWCDKLEWFGRTDPRTL